MGMLALCREKFGTAYMHPEKSAQGCIGLMWSVIGEVFFYSLLLLYFSFFLFSHQPTTGLPGVLGFCLLTTTVEGHASRIMWGMSQTMVWGHHGTWVRGI